MMQAAIEGAAALGRPVAGIRIAKEAGTRVRSGSYLPEQNQVRGGEVWGMGRGEGGLIKRWFFLSNFGT